MCSGPRRRPTNCRASGRGAAAAAAAAAPAAAPGRPAPASARAREWWWPGDHAPLVEPLGLALLDARARDAPRAEGPARAWGCAVGACVDDGLLAGLVVATGGAAGGYAPHPSLPPAAAALLAAAAQGLGGVPAAAGGGAGGPPDAVEGGPPLPSLRATAEAAGASVEALDAAAHAAIERATGLGLRRRARPLPAAAGDSPRGGGER